MSNESADFLLGSGTPSAKFPTIGTTIAGTITEPPTVVDQRDLDGEIKTWANGDPMKMLVVTLQTSERDADISDDTGMRKLYVKGSKDPKSKSMTAALGQAVKTAKANGLEVGGTLTVTYVSDGEQEKKGFNPPKQFEATYIPPSVTASADFLGASEPAQPTAPASAPSASAASPVGNPGDLAKQLIAAGLDDTTIAASTGLPMVAIAALRNVA